MKDAWLVVSRVTVGLMFLLSGWGKVANLEKFAADFAHWDVPAPTATSASTAWGELLCGVLLIIGVLTRLVATGLTAIMIGAIVYSVWPSAWGASTTVMGFFSEFFYSSEWLLVLVLTALMLIGPGRLSLDEAVGFERRIREGFRKTT